MHAISLFSTLFLDTAGNGYALMGQHLIAALAFSVLGRAGADRQHLADVQAGSVLDQEGN